MRLISLCPSLTELLFDLERGDALVGVTDYCVHPADGVAGIEKVGGTKTPDVQRIVALAPDLVLLNEEENRVEDAEALRGAGVACHTSFPRDSLETAQMVRSIGEAVQRTAGAERIAEEIERRTARVRSRAGSPVRWAYMIWRKPWMSVNADTFAHALLSQAGGVNVFAEREERYPEVTLEELRAARADAVFLCTEPYDFQQADALEVAAACGLDPARVVVADGEFLSWHGSRTPEGIDYAEGLIAAARAHVGSA